MKKTLRAVVLSASMLAMAIPCMAAPKTKAKKVKFDSAKYEKAYQSGDYATCLGMLQSITDPDQNKDYSTNLILNLMNEGMINRFGQNYEDSALILDEAAKTMETYTNDLESKGKSDAGKSFQRSFSNEAAVQYEGATYEFILSDSMSAVSSIFGKDYDNARAISHRIGIEKRKEIVSLNDKAKEKANAPDNLDAKEAKEESEEKKDSKVKLPEVNIDTKKIMSLGPKQLTAAEIQANIYTESPFAYYLGALLFAEDKDSDNANKLLELYNAYCKNTKTTNYLSSKDISPSSGRLNLIVLANTIAQRTECSKELEVLPSSGFIYFNKAGNLATTDIGIPLTFKLTYPQVEPQNHKVKKVKVTLSDGQTVTLDLSKDYIENFDKAVEMDVNLKARKAYNRSMFRNISRKVSAWLGGGVVVANAIDTGLPAVAVNTAKKPFEKALANTDEKEHPDLRQANHFPSTASVAAFDLEPGSYNATVEYLDENGKVLHTEKINKISVANGKPTVIASEYINTNVK